MRYRRLFVVAALACGCGSSGGGAPEFIGLEDHRGVVGSEMFFEVRASDPELAALEFGLEGTAPSSSTARLTQLGSGNGALFRWTPAASDVGIWIFDFVVTDGVNTTVESITLTVESAAGDAPVFRKPLGAGTTLDLSAADCLDLDIVVDDPDSSLVEVTQAEPLITGATLGFVETTLRWQWCPNKDQIASDEAFVLALAADDGQHRIVKHFVIVLRNGPLSAPVDLGGFRIRQNADTTDGVNPCESSALCEFTLPEPFEVERGATVIIARDSSRAAFEEYWGKTLPQGTVFISSGNRCPLINGDETYVLCDSAGQAVDGPTQFIFEGENAQRLDPALPAGETASWSFEFINGSDADRAIATPGVPPDVEPTASRAYISEFSDAPGIGNFVFEFVELAVD